MCIQLQLVVFQFSQQTFLDLLYTVAYLVFSSFINVTVSHSRCDTVCARRLKLRQQLFQDFQLFDCLLFGSDSFSFWCVSMSMFMCIIFLWLFSIFGFDFDFDFIRFHFNCTVVAVAFYLVCLRIFFCFRGYCYCCDLWKLPFSVFGSFECISVIDIFLLIVCLSSIRSTVWSGLIVVLGISKFLHHQIARNSNWTYICCDCCRFNPHF